MVIGHLQSNAVSLPQSQRSNVTAMAIAPAGNAANDCGYSINELAYKAPSINIEHKTYEFGVYVKKKYAYAHICIYIYIYCQHPLMMYIDIYAYRIHIHNDKQIPVDCPNGVIAVGRWKNKNTLRHLQKLIATICAVLGVTLRVSSSSRLPVM